MAYFVEIVPSVRNYLGDIENLSSAGFDSLIDGIINELGHDADRFLMRNAIAHESLYFRYDYALFDGDNLFDFDFVVDGTARVSGVVRIVYVEHTIRQIP